jgi:hypothetical protein
MPLFSGIATKERFDYFPPPSVVGRGIGPANRSLSGRQPSEWISDGLDPVGGGLNPACAAEPAPFTTDMEVVRDAWLSQRASRGAVVDCPSGRDSRFCYRWSSPVRPSRGLTLGRRRVCRSWRLDGDSRAKPCRVTATRPLGRRSLCSVSRIVATAGPGRFAPHEGAAACGSIHCAWSSANIQYGASGRRRARPLGSQARNAGSISLQSE